MTDAAEHYNFEAAAALRDRIVAVRRVTEGAESRLALAPRHGPHRGRARARSSLHASLHGARRQTASAKSTSSSTACTTQSDARAVLPSFSSSFTPRAAASWRPRRRIAGSPLALRAARDKQVAGRRKSGARAPRQRRAAIPKEILVKRCPTSATVIESWLTELKGQRVRILRAATRRARRLPAARAEERRAESQSVSRASRSARNRAGALADRTRRCARPARAAAPHRVLRHLEHPGHEPRQLDGRVRRRAGEEERLPQLQDPVRSRSERLRDDARDAAPPACATCADETDAAAEARAARRASWRREREVQQEARPAARSTAAKGSSARSSR